MSASNRVFRRQQQQQQQQQVTRGARTRSAAAAAGAANQQPSRSGGDGRSKGAAGEDRSCPRNRQRLKHKFNEVERNILMYQLESCNRQIIDLEEQVKILKNPRLVDGWVQLDPPEIPIKRDKHTQVCGRNFRRDQKTTMHLANVRLRNEHELIEIVYCDLFNRDRPSESSSTSTSTSQRSEADRQLSDAKPSDDIELIDPRRGIEYFHNSEPEFRQLKSVDRKHDRSNRSIRGPIDEELPNNLAIIAPEARPSITAAAAAASTPPNQQEYSIIFSSQQAIATALAVWLRQARILKFELPNRTRISTRSNSQTRIVLPPFFSNRPILPASFQPKTAEPTSSTRMMPPNRIPSPNFEMLTDDDGIDTIGIAMCDEEKDLLLRFRRHKKLMKDRRCRSARN